MKRLICWARGHKWVAEVCGYADGALSLHFACVRCGHSPTSQDELDRIEVWEYDDVSLATHLPD